MKTIACGVAAALILVGCHTITEELPTQPTTTPGLTRPHRADPQDPRGTPTPTPSPDPQALADTHADADAHPDADAEPPAGAATRCPRPSRA